MNKEFKKLELLVNMNIGNETKCRDALIPFANLLIGNSSLVFDRAEWSSDRGRVDLILIVEPIDTQFGAKLLTTDKIALVYELKAPNKKVFEYHPSKRFIPSKDLCLAESQLFDYTQRSLQDLLYFSQQFGANDVRPGGIIIGRESTMFHINRTVLKNIKDMHKFENLKRATINARKRFLYDKAVMNVYTWDHVLNLIRSTI
jgi:hypothetical protein